MAYSLRPKPLRPTHQRPADQPAWAEGPPTSPPSRQSCRLRRRSASRRRVDAPSDQGIDVRRSIRDDPTIGRQHARRMCQRSPCWHGPTRPWGNPQHGCDGRAIPCARRRAATDRRMGRRPTEAADVLQSERPTGSKSDRGPPRRARRSKRCRPGRRRPGDRGACRLLVAWRQSERSGGTRSRCRRRSGEHRARNGLPDGAGCQRARRMPDPGLRQQRAALLDGCPGGIGTDLPVR